MSFGPLRYQSGVGLSLGPYSINRPKRLVKTPKLYWSDRTLARWLSGAPSPSGAHLETLVLLDLLVWRDSQVPAPEVLYWRTTTDLEVDFVIESGDRLLPIEIKATANPGCADTRDLRAFREQYPEQCIGGLLLLAVPW